MCKAISKLQCHFYAQLGIDCFIDRFVLNLAKASPHSTAPVINPEEANIPSFVDVRTNWI